MGINDYLKAIQRRWPVVIVAGLLGLLVGYLVAPGAANPLRYSATTTVLQAPDVKDPVESTALLVTSDAVAERVSRTLTNQAAPQKVLLRITAVADKASNAIAVTASDAEPQAAVALANTFATATVEEFRVRHAAAAATKFRSLEGQLTEVDNQLKQIARQVAGSTGAASGPVNPVLQARASVLSSRYAEIYSLLQEAANQANDPAGLETLSPANDAKSNASAFSLSSTTARTVVGLILGLFLGAALALALEHFDTRPRDRAAARSAYRLPVLAEIPKVRHSEWRDFAVITASQPESSAAEAYRSLRSTIMFTDCRIHHLGREESSPNGSAVNTRQPPRVLLVASARAAEGKTTTVVNLAACFADVGKRVLVLDCDFRGPDAHQYLGVSPGAGLSNLLTSATTVDLLQHVRQSDIPRVDIITAGTRLERPSSLPSRMADVVTQARELADVVLIDSAPMLLANDAMDLMPYVDAVLVVSYAGRATSEQAQRASELLTRTQAPVIGIALVGVKGRSYQDVMSYSRGTREDPLATDLSQRPSLRMTAPTPASSPAEQDRAS